MSVLSQLDTIVREPRTARHLYRTPGAAVMPKTFDLDIGVIYSGERHFMDPLVSSLAGSANGISPRLILVDNVSTDGVAAWTSTFAHTKVVKNDRPLGYAENLNRILSVSDARYVLLLNTDMYFDVGDQCLAKMVAFMDDHPRCGLSVCQIYRPDGSYGYPARRFPTVRTIAARRLGLQRLLAGPLREHLYEDRPITDSYPCDWVSGCFMLVRREAAQDVGRFDERYVKYFEDVDMCLRMARAGWQVMFNGATRCFHHEQRASRHAFSRDAWRHGRAYLRWLLKWGLTTPSSGELGAVTAWTAQGGKRIDPAQAATARPHTGVAAERAPESASAPPRSRS
jgi:GT2 family glycosyltransferase